ncbi:MAG: hypothetical protein ACJ786_04945 [Catenulispora sp.]
MTAVPVDEDQVRDWEEIVRDGGWRYWFQPALELMCDALTTLAKAQAALAIPMGQALRLRVQQVVIRSAGLAGMMFADGGRPEQAYECLYLAARAAARAGDREFACWAHAVTAHVAFIANDHGRLLQEAETAKRLAPSPMTVGAAYAEAATAMAHATDGDGGKASACLERCGEIYAGLDRSQTTLSVFGYPEPLYQYHRGYVLTRTQQPALARESLLMALETCPPTAFVPRIAVRLELIRCYLDEGRTTEACGQVTPLLAEHVGAYSSTALSRLVNQLFSLFVRQEPDGGINHG